MTAIVEPAFAATEFLIGVTAPADPAPGGTASVAALVVYVLLALGVSFACSIMEAVLLSLTPSYIEMTTRERPRMGRRLQNLKATIDRPLAAILSLNTIAHTVGAAGAGAEAAELFGSAYLGLISAILTLLILVISEIIPKTLGAIYWRQLAGGVALVLGPTILLMWPLVKLSEGLTWLLSRGQRPEDVSREEIRAMADLGRTMGLFEENEARILKNLFRFGALRARDAMTPRTVVLAFPESKTLHAVLDEFPELPFSRIPLMRETLDQVTGYVLKDSLLMHAAQHDDDRPLADFRRDLLVVPEQMRITTVLSRLLENREHVAAVVDEYGGTAGIITMEDVIETILGLEIIDEVDPTPDMRELARRLGERRAKRLKLVPMSASTESAVLPAAPSASQESALPDPPPSAE